MSKEMIINLQTEIIQEYKIQQIYFSQIFMDVVRLYKGRTNLTEAEKRLLDFSWTCNTLIEDNTLLYGLKSELHKETKSIES